MTHPRLGAECQRKQLRFVRRSRQRGAGSRSAFPGERASLANSNTAGTRNAGGRAEQAKGTSGHGCRFIGFIRAIYRTYDSDLTQCNTKQHGDHAGALTHGRQYTSWPAGPRFARRIAGMLFWNVPVLAPRPFEHRPCPAFQMVFWQVLRRKVLRV